MAQKIIINNEEYDLVSAFFYKTTDLNSRDRAIITMNKTHDEMVELFPDGVVWKIKTINDDESSTIVDYSDFCITGQIVDYRNGNTDISMGKMTELERMIAIIYGGVNNE